MKTTLWDILNNNIENYNISLGIEIPKIQRDYAQGRINEKANEVREIFLNELYKAFEKSSELEHRSLDLDFVYGINENNKFIPLDGQQRITTLYLIFWYLAFRDQKLVEHAIPFSKFNYETRPSSGYFLKKINSELDQRDYREIFTLGKKFSDTIKNKNWYFINWNYDLTIQSMIVMLDAIHEKFNKLNIRFSDILHLQTPPVTFNFLQIKDFGLTDNLYIKMNSRGKPLTSFENLKAEFGQFIKDSDFNTLYNFYLESKGERTKVTVEDYFLTKIDNQWSDYFWNLKNNQNIFDDKLLNLLSFIGFNELIKTDRESFEVNIEEFNKEDFLITYYSLTKLGLINEETIITYMNVLDKLSEKNTIFENYLKEGRFYEETLKPILEHKTTRSEYERRVIFYGTFQFIILRPAHTALELSRWSKLIHNLVINTIYNRSKDFVDSILGVDEFLSIYNDNVYESYLKFGIKGFDTVQTAEEIIKISLKLSYSSFEELIDKIEDNGFLNGQISSILKFSGVYDCYTKSNFLNYTEVDYENLKKDLEDAYNKYSLCFDEQGLRLFENEDFRRALLCIDNYSRYSTNWFFYNNLSHRDLSWKRLLKEVVNMGNTYAIGANALITLFSKLTTSSPIIDQLNVIIKDHLKHEGRKDWKYYFIKYPLLFRSSKQYYVKVFENFEDEYIYCLNKTKYNANTDYDFMSLVLLSELKKKNIDTHTIQFGYQSKYDQFGITHINGNSVKIVYNSPIHRHKFVIKVYEQEEFFETSLDKTIQFIIDYYFS
jgi:hypothetical protein